MNKLVSRVLFLFFLSLSVVALAQAAPAKHTIKTGKGIHKVAHLTGRVVVASAELGLGALNGADIEALIDSSGVGIQGFADGLDMLVAAPFEAMPKPFSYIGRGVHQVYLKLDKVGQFLAQ